MTFLPDDTTLPDLLEVEDFIDRSGGKVKRGDDRVGPLISGATKAIRRYCQWHVGGPVTHTLRGDWDGSGLIVLPTLRLLDVTSLKIHGESVDVEQLEWSHGGLIRVGRRFRPSFRAVEVTITHGFEDPDDLTQIIQQVVGVALSSPMGATSEQAGQVSVRWATTSPGVSGGLALLDRDMAVLDSYRLAKRP